MSFTITLYYSTFINNDNFRLSTLILRNNKFRNDRILIIEFRVNFLSSINNIA